MAGRVDGVYEVDPISRIEGHLGVKLTTTGGVVSEADVHGNLWRGFENFLLNRDANDAITFTQRICGVCPVPHGQTSTYAVDAVLGYSRSHITFAYDGSYGVPAKAVYIRNLVLGAEFLMSNLTHFYHLVALDYVQGPATPPWTPYFDDSFYSTLLLNPTAAGYSGTSNSLGALPSQTGGFSDGLWDAAVTQYVKALRIRRLTFEAGALFAGRMPMTSCFVGGGVTNDGTEDLSDRCATYKTIMEEIADFIIKEHVPLVLALGYLYKPYDNKFNNGKLAGDPDVGADYGFGAGCGNFVAWGAFPNPVDDTLDLPGGVRTKDGLWSFKACSKQEIYNSFLGDVKSGWTDSQLPDGDRSMLTNISESIANSRYGISDFDVDNIDATTKKGSPAEVQRTMPVRANGYSYIKSPRWADYPCEVGPFARMVVCEQVKVDGTALATTVTGYMGYTRTTNGTTGLNPAMIFADLAVALVREGVAVVEVDDGAGGVTPAVDPIDAYVNDPTAIITGPITDWVIGLKGGLSTMDRLRARAIESLYLVQKILGWVDGLNAITGGVGDDVVGSTWRDKAAPTAAASGWGATEAPRGALAHFATINASGKLTAYQCVVPTTWNASPKDYYDVRGPMEESMIGIPFDDAGASFTGIDGTTTINAQAGIEALRVAHTFDPCIACAIH